MDGRPGGQTVNNLDLTLTASSVFQGLLFRLYRMLESLPFDSLSAFAFFRFSHGTHPSLFHTRSRDTTTELAGKKISISNLLQGGTAIQISKESHHPRPLSQIPIAVSHPQKRSTTCLWRQISFKTRYALAPLTACRTASPSSLIRDPVKGSLTASYIFVYPSVGLPHETDGTPRYQASRPPIGHLNLVSRTKRVSR